MRKESIRLLKQIQSLGEPTVKEITAVAKLTDRNIQLRLNYLMLHVAVSRQRALPIRIEGKRGGAFRVYKYAITDHGANLILEHQYKEAIPRSSVFDNGPVAST